MGGPDRDGGTDGRTDPDETSDSDETADHDETTDSLSDHEAVKGLVGRHWNWRAPTFDAESQHGIHSEAQRERWLSVLDERTGDPPRRVLDVGCGTGFLAVLLAELGHAVTGVDVAPAMLDRARTKARRFAARTDGATSGDAAGRLAFCRGDAERLPVADDAVDLVVARHLVWTLPAPPAALREWHRVLAPGGRILLVEGHWDHDEPWDEYRRVHDDLPLYDGRPPAELADLVADQGFAAVDYDPLDDPVLWGRDPSHEYYLLAGETSQ